MDDPLSAALSRLDAAVDLVEGWVAAHDGTAEHWLDMSVYSKLSLPIVEVIPDLRELLCEGHEATITYEVVGFNRVILLRASGSSIARGKQGAWKESGLPEAQAEVAAAAERVGAWELLEALGTAMAEAEIKAEVKAEIKVKNFPAQSGFHWIRERASLGNKYLSGTGWITLLAAAPPRPERPRLIVHDLGDGYVCARGLCVHGRTVEPDDLPALPAPQPADGYEDNTPDTPDTKVLKQASVYAEEWLKDDRDALPPPFLLEPTALLESTARREGSADAAPADPAFLQDVQEWMLGAAQALTWIWLAETAVIDGDGVRFEWQGAAKVKLPEFDADADDELFTAEPEPTREAIQLWKMAIATEDDLRHEAVHQAIQAIVRAPEDLRKAAAPVLRRARFVLKIAEENRTGEAMATLRAARQAAVDAASTIAGATRGAARGVVDRVFASVISALAVLLANKGNVINDAVAFWLLGAVGAVVVATWVIAHFIEYPDAAALHEAATNDLQRYRDLLDETELKELTAGSLATAEKQLQRSRRISKWIAVTGIAVVGIMLFLVLTTGSRAAPPPESPTKSDQTAPPAEAASRLVEAREPSGSLLARRSCAYHRSCGSPAHGAPVMRMPLVWLDV